MKKSKRQLNSEMVINALNSGRFGYEILNRNKKGVVNHVRVAGWGDIWPTTFTYLRNGKWSKNNAKKLFDALADHDGFDDDIADHSYSKALAELNSLVPILGVRPELFAFCKAQIESAGFVISEKPKTKRLSYPENEYQKRLKREALAK